MKIDISIANRAVSYTMEYDPTFVADVSTRVAMEHTPGCEPELVHLMFRTLREGDLVFDVGANIGFFTLMMAGLVGRTGKVLAFEPAPNNADKLLRNLRLNKIENVEIVQKPVWCEEAELPFFLEPDSGRCALRRTEDTVCELRMKTVVLASYGTPRFVKIDVEGAETDVIAGSTLRAETTPYVVCELNEEALHRFMRNQDTLRSLLWARDYEPFLMDAQGKMPTMLPRMTRAVTDRCNRCLLFSTIDAVGEAWPEVAI